MVDFDKMVDMFIEGIYREIVLLDVIDEPQTDNDLLILDYIKDSGEKQSQKRI